MAPAVGAAGQIPDAPRVDVAEGQVSGIRRGACAIDVVEHPFDLRAREIGRQGQACLRAETILPALRGERVHDVLCSGVLPDQRVIDRLAGSPVPDHGRLALVGDAN